MRRSHLRRLIREIILQEDKTDDMYEEVYDVLDALDKKYGYHLRQAIQDWQNDEQPPVRNHNHKMSSSDDD